MRASFPEQFPDLFVAMSLAHRFDALFNRWKPNLLVRRDCFFTHAIQGVVANTAATFTLGPNALLEGNIDILDKTASDSFINNGTVTADSSTTGPRTVSS